MPSLARGESSSATTPVLDIFTAIGNPPSVVDVVELEFRVLDISSALKRAFPVQIYPVGPPGTYQVVDPLLADPAGVRLGVGHYFAPFTVPLDCDIGDHRIEWQFKLTTLTPYEFFTEEFFVTESAFLGADTYCGVGDIRAEGFTDTVAFPDSRIEMLAQLSRRYIDKVCQRWFGARTFDDTNPLLYDGNDARTLHLEVPIIRLDKLSIEHQGLLNPDITEIDAAEYRVYNRHMTGLQYPDDRENPRIAFIQRRINEVVSSGLYPAPRYFAMGRQNIHLEGVFGYTDPDGSPFGIVPPLIAQVSCRLIIRDLLLDADACAKLNVKNKWRIIFDKEGTTSVRLHEIWLKGGFTGDSEIDNVLTMYRAPPRIGIA